MNSWVKRYCIAYFQVEINTNSDNYCSRFSILISKVDSTDEEPSGGALPSYILHTYAFWDLFIGWVIYLEKMIISDGILHVKSLIQILYVMVFYM